MAYLFTHLSYAGIFVCGHRLQGIANVAGPDILQRRTTVAPDDTQEHANSRPEMNKIPIIFDSNGNDIHIYV